MWVWPPKVLQCFSREGLLEGGSEYSNVSRVGEKESLLVSQALQFVPHLRRRLNLTRTRVESYLPLKAVISTSWEDALRFRPEVVGRVDVDESAWYPIFIYKLYKSII